MERKLRDDKLMICTRQQILFRIPMIKARTVSRGGGLVVRLESRRGAYGILMGKR